jgi:RNA polymerase sigma-70 factor (ECF subfamily)
VAYRILGNAHDVDDALQDAWIRLSKSDADQIENITGWLTTVVARICLNILRTKQRRPAESFDESFANVERLSERTATSPEEQVELADSMGLALLIVLETLSPAERITFVLHDMFSVPFDEIAEMLGKSPETCRQLASRARRRVRTANDPTANPKRQREVVDAFLDASKSGPFDVATRFSGGARAARTALLDGLAGLVWAQGGNPKIVFEFTVVSGKVTRIDMIGDEEILGEMSIDYVRRGR